eukprot:TRINITY_DN3630_c0_g1_i1.p1 TRINITY_DN3630_c0_g1~~TRINITY_DN3630_c0_g1_i1.p1  ORF type:complete len:415 (+),score=70.32 TRINITY_DN3630_c0_g1_i1:124-1245(+)
MTLKLVQVITRHGDRTGYVKVPVDHSVWDCNLTTFLAPSPKEEETVELGRIFRKNYIENRQLNLGNCYAGQLTSRGFNQHLALGQSLRSIYVDLYHFLDLNKSTEEQVAIRSTDVPRTLASAQAHFQGLFPQQDNQTDEIPVVDIFTIEADLDNLVGANPTLCPRLVQINELIAQDPVYVAYMQNNSDFLAELTSLLNYTDSAEWIWEDLLDVFEVMKCYDTPYPPGITQDMVDRTLEIANWQENFQLNNTELVKLSIGSFTQELIDAMQRVMDGEEMPLYMIYSGHDVTIAPLLASLSVFDGEWPPYAAHTEIELWFDSEKEEYQVLVRYQGENVQLPYCVDDGYLCPYSYFYKGVSVYLPVDFSAECGNSL